MGQGVGESEKVGVGVRVTVLVRVKVMVRVAERVGLSVRDGEGLAVSDWVGVNVSVAALRPLVPQEMASIKRVIWIAMPDRQNGQPIEKAASLS